MKKLILLLLLAPVRILPAVDIGGWGEVRWGMTLPAVLAAYPRAELTGAVETNTAKLTLPRFKIGSDQFTVRFFFDQARQLSEVSLIFESGGSNVMTKIVASSLRDQLTQKYGRPSLVEGGDVQRVVWTAEGTVVHLTYVPSFNDLAVAYTKPNASVLGKL